MKMKAKRHTLANALHLAASRYEEDATFLRSAPKPDDPLRNIEARSRLAEQFERQAKEVRTLVDAIEQADKIRLED
jgi:hypothetical protein